MNLTDIGLYVSIFGVVLGFLAIMLSFMWHRNDRLAEKLMQNAKTSYEKGDRIKGAEWHQKSQSKLRTGVRIRQFGILCLYPGYALMLLGFLFLVIGNYSA